MCGQEFFLPSLKRSIMLSLLVSWLKETLKQEAVAMGKEAAPAWREFLAKEPKIPQIKHKQVATILFPFFFSVGKKNNI